MMYINTKIVFTKCSSNEAEGPHRGYHVMHNGSYWTIVPTEGGLVHNICMTDVSIDRDFIEVCDIYMYTTIGTRSLIALSYHAYLLSQ